MGIGDDNTYANTDTHADADPNTNAYTNTNTNAYAYSDSNPRLRNVCGRHDLSARSSCEQCWRFLSL